MTTPNKTIEKELMELVGELEINAETICIETKKWSVVIHRQGKYIGLGYFSTKNEAAKIYNDNIKKYNGKFIRLNKIVVPN